MVEVQLAQYVGNTFYGSGGGATHMATRSGLLSSLVSYNNDVLIVSGGGGGASTYSNLAYAAHGGNAGGIQGMAGKVVKIDRNVSCTGGTQKTPGTGTDTIGMGYGVGGSLYSYVGPGAGAGYYGGGTSEVISCGGSSYIGNTLLKNKTMYCYDCTESKAEDTLTKSVLIASQNPEEFKTKKGNGFAKITFLKTN